MKWGLIAVLGLVLRLVLLQFFYRLYIDDAYIFMHYAENFAHGQGLVFNPGEKVMGFTSPIYTVLLGLLALLPIALPITVAILNSIIFVAVTWLFSKTEQTHRLWWLVPAAWALYFPFVDAGVNGMETLLFIGAMFGAVELLRRGKADAATVVTILTALIRPEGAMFCVAMLPVVFITKTKFPLRGLLVGLGIVAIWAAIATSYYGSVLPQSMLAKSGRVTVGLGGESVSPLDMLASTSLGFSSDIMSTLPHAAVYGLWCAVAIGLVLFALGLRRLWSDRSPFLAIPFAFILIWLFYVAGKPVHLWTWYTIPPATAFIWTALIPIGQYRKWPALAAVALVLLGSLAIGVPKRLGRMKELAWQIDGVADKINRDYPRARSVAVADIGLIGFKTNRHVVDLAGLVTRSTTKTEGGELISLGTILEEQKPDILLLRSDPLQSDTVSDAMVHRRTFSNDQERQWFRDHYEPADFGSSWYQAVYVRRWLTNSEGELWEP